MLVESRLTYLFTYLFILKLLSSLNGLYKRTCSFVSNTATKVYKVPDLFLTGQTLLLKPIVSILLNIPLSTADL